MCYERGPGGTSIQYAPVRKESPLNFFKNIRQTVLDKIPLLVLLEEETLDSLRQLVNRLRTH